MSKSAVYKGTPFAKEEFLHFSTIIKPILGHFMYTCIKFKIVCSLVQRFLIETSMYRNKFYFKTLYCKLIVLQEMIELILHLMLT